MPIKLTTTYLMFKLYNTVLTIFLQLRNLVDWVNFRQKAGPATARDDSASEELIDTVILSHRPVFSGLKEQ
jgi:hypothetical protein